MMLSEHLPVFAVVVPLTAAPVAVILFQRQLAWLWTLLSTSISFIISVRLCQQVLETGAIKYNLGAWPDPWGISLNIDAANAFVLLIVSGISLFTALYAYNNLDKELNRRYCHQMFSAMLLLQTGLSGMIVTGDAFNVFVFMEITALATYALVSMGPDRRALVAGFRYLLMGAVGSTFVLLGIGLLYMLTGTLNMADLYERLADHRDSKVFFTACAFILAGMGIKLAMFPVHSWLPNVYTYSPTFVAAMLSGTATKVAIYVMLRFIYSVMGAQYILAELHFGTVYLVLGAFTCISMSLVAIFQADLKKILAYSSIAQIGYILIGIGLGTDSGLQAAIIHVFNHAVVKTAMFMLAGCLLVGIGSTLMNRLAGQGRHMPWTSAALVLAGLSLVGLPLTTGFISKWMLLSASFDAKAYLVLATIVVSSLAGIAYLWRIVETLYLKPAAPSPSTFDKSKHGLPPLMLMVPVALLGVNLYFGMDATRTEHFAKLAARDFMHPELATKPEPYSALYGAGDDNEVAIELPLSVADRDAMLKELDMLRAVLASHSGVKTTTLMFNGKPVEMPPADALRDMALTKASVVTVLSPSLGKEDAEKLLKELSQFGQWNRLPSPPLDADSDGEQP